MATGVVHYNSSRSLPLLSARSNNLTQNSTCCFMNGMALLRPANELMLDTRSALKALSSALERFI